MYLYLDLIWLLNFCIDYLLLWLTALFIRQPCQKWRLALAAGLGSSYILILFIPTLFNYYTFLTKCILSVLIVLVAFGFPSVERFIKSYFMFCFVSFVTGGGLLAVHYLVQSQHQIMQGMVATQSAGYGDPVSWLFVVIGFPLLYWFSKRQWKGIEGVKIKADFLVDVDIFIDQKRITVTGLVDTGNQLYHPLSKKPVMIVEAKQLESLVPQSVLSIIHHIDQWGGVKNGTDINWLNRLSIMPYRGVGQKMGLLCTLHPDQVIIRTKTDTFCTNDVLVGLSPSSLSRDGLFAAIVHPDLLRESALEEMKFGEVVSSAD